MDFFMGSSHETHLFMDHENFPGFSWVFHCICSTNEKIFMGTFMGFIIGVSWLTLQLWKGAPASSALSQASH